MNSPDCGSTICIYVKDKKGMRTNGPCRCDSCPKCNGVVRPAKVGNIAAHLKHGPNCPQKDWLPSYHMVHKDKPLVKSYFAILTWQNNPNVHPLTCGVNSRHRNNEHSKLYPVILGNRLFLLCPYCNYRQDDIPGVVTGGQDG